MTVEIRTFGFRYRKDDMPGLVFDCTKLVNPFKFPEYRDGCGLDKDIAHYVNSTDKAKEIVDKAVNSVLRKGVTQLAFGCLGGRHRSVAVAERVAGQLTALGYNTSVHHVEIERWK